MTVQEVARRKDVEVVAGGAGDERAGHGARRHQLGAHPLHVRGVAARAPLHQQRDELVELRSAHRRLAASEALVGMAPLPRDDRGD